MGFLELRLQCGVSYVVRRGAQGAYRVASGKSGLHPRDERECVIALESWEGTRAQDALKKDYRGLSGVVAGNPGFCRLLPVTSESFSGCL